MNLKTQNEINRWLYLIRPPSLSQENHNKAADINEPEKDYSVEDYIESVENAYALLVEMVEETVGNPYTDKVVCNVNTNPLAFKHLPTDLKEKYGNNMEEMLVLKLGFKFKHQYLFNRIFCKLSCNCFGF